MRRRRNLAPLLAARPPGLSGFTPRSDSVEAEFDPASLFAGGKVGDWWLGGTPYTTTGRTVVAGVGDTVASLTGTVNGNHLIQATAAREPTLAANNLLTFGGTHGLYVPSIAWAAKELTLIFVVQSMVTPASSQIIFETSNNWPATDGSIQYYVGSGGDLFGVIQDSSTSSRFRQESAAGFTSADPVMAVVEFDNMTTTGDVTIRYGVTAQSTTLGLNNKDQSSNFATTALNFGARDAAGTIAAGAVFTGVPVLAINRFLTAGELDDVAAEVTRLTGIS